MLGALLIVATIVLGILEVAGVLAIGWLWVFAPLWIPLAFTAGVFLLGLLFLFAGLLISRLAGEDKAKKSLDDLMREMGR